MVRRTVLFRSCISPGARISTEHLWLKVWVVNRNQHLSLLLFTHFAYEEGFPLVWHFFWFCHHHHHHHHHCQLTSIRPDSWTARQGSQGSDLNNRKLDKIKPFKICSPNHFPTFIFKPNGVCKYVVSDNDDDNAWGNIFTSKCGPGCAQGLSAAARSNPFHPNLINTLLSPSGDLGIGLVWHNLSPDRTATFRFECWNPLQSELNYLWGVLSCSQDDIRWF